jgi:hypothetical protein
VKTKIINMDMPAGKKDLKSECEFVSWGCEEKVSLETTAQKF